MSYLPVNTPMGQLAIEQVIEYYDFPRIFTCRNKTGQAYFGLSVFDDEEIDEYHWLYIAVSNLRLEAILLGGISLRKAFVAPENGHVLRVITRQHSDSLHEYLLPEQLSDDMLPLATYFVKVEESIASQDFNIGEPKAIAEATHREVFNYHIFPEQTNKHEIPARKLGGILSSTQDLLDALGQACLGEPTIRGPLPAELLQATKVNVTHVFRGSFGVQFRSATYNDLLDESAVSLAMTQFANLLIAGDSEDLLSNKLHNLKGRVASKYRKLLKELSEVESGLFLNWGAVMEGRGGEYSLTHSQIRKAYEIVDRIDIEMADEVVFEGYLVGFNSRTKRFEIRELEDGKAYAGRVADDADLLVPNPAIGEIYKAKLRMLVETQSTSGDEIVRWVLVQLGPR